jgi:hypothetical protein
MSQTMYTRHQDIPQKYRRAILDESGESRIHRVSLEECNEIIADFEALETENENLKKFKLEVKRFENDIVHEYIFNNYRESLIALDRELDYSISTPKDIVAVISQNGRPVRAYVKGEIIVSRSMYE